MTDNLPGEDALKAFEASGRRVLIHLMKFKQALTAHLPLAAAFDAYREALGRVAAADALRRRRVVSLRDAVAHAGGAFYETAPAGEPFAIEPPRVIGEGNHRPLQGVARSLFVGCVIDARVRGRSAFIEVNDVALLDFQGGELARIDDQFELDPAVFQASGNDAARFIEPADMDGGGIIRLEEGFALLGPWTLEFGHWMWDYLPRLVAALRSGALPPVPIIVDADLPRTHRQALELMLPKGNEIIMLPAFAPACVRRLWCAASLMYMPLHERDNGRFQWDYVASPQQRFGAVIAEMRRRAVPASTSSSSSAIAVTSSERLFLARKPGLHHPLANAGAIEAIARARGFAILYPEEYAFADQVSLLRDARFVAGPDGSAINFLPWFARPGTRVCNLTHDYTLGLTALTGLLEAGGIEVTVVTGMRREMREEYPEFVEYEVDPVRISSFLDRWLDDAITDSPCSPAPVHSVQSRPEIADEVPPAPILPKRTMTPALEIPIYGQCFTSRPQPLALSLRLRRRGASLAGDGACLTWLR